MEEGYGKSENHGDGYECREENILKEAVQTVPLSLRL
jgi:hypothetical protein